MLWIKCWNKENGECWDQTWFLNPVYILWKSWTLPRHFYLFSFSFMFFFSPYRWQHHPPIERLHQKHLILMSLSDILVFFTVSSSANGYIVNSRILIFSIDANDRFNIFLNRAPPDWKLDCRDASFVCLYVCFVRFVLSRWSVLVASFVCLFHGFRFSSRFLQNFSVSGVFLIFALHTSYKPHNCFRQ